MKALTDKRLNKKLFKLVIDLYDALVDTNHGGWNGVTCDHEKWGYLIKKHGRKLGVLREAALMGKIRRDKGKCSSCGGDAKVCYPRHAAGRSCG